MSRPRRREPVAIAPPAGYPTAANTCAVIVTFHPDADFPGRLARIRRLVDHVIIVDNDSSDPIREVLRQLADGDSGVKLHENSENLGVSTALNQGVEFARSLGCGWALLFDQDSIVEPRMLDMLAEAWKGHPDPRRIGMLGANYRHMPHGRLEFEAPPGAVLYHPRPYVITSGTLLPITTHERIGRFRDDFFIDNIDYEYSLRCAANRLEVLITSLPLMDHPVGQASLHELTGRLSVLRFVLATPVVCGNHAPFRRYYNSRNTIALAREYWSSNRTFMVWLIKGLWIESIIAMFLFERHRARKVLAMAIGLFHGLTRRMGRFTFAPIGALPQPNDATPPLLAKNDPL